MKSHDDLHEECGRFEADPLLLTVREAAKILRISADLAYSLVRADVLPAIRLGARRVVIPREALLRWIHNQAQTTPQILSGPSVRSMEEVVEQP